MGACWMGAVHPTRSVRPVRIILPLPPRPGAFRRSVGDPHHGPTTREARVSTQGGNRLNVESIRSDTTIVARRISILFLALVVGVAAISLAGFFLMRRGIQAQNDRLLQADAGQAAQLLAADFGGLSASLASLGTVAQVTSGSPDAFDQHAQALAVHGSSVALVRQSG